MKVKLIKATDETDDYGFLYGEAYKARVDVDGDLMVYEKDENDWHFFDLGVEFEEVKKETDQVEKNTKNIAWLRSIVEGHLPPGIRYMGFEE